MNMYVCVCVCVYMYKYTQNILPALTWEFSNAPLNWKETDVFCHSSWLTSTESCVAQLDKMRKPKLI